MPKKGKATSKKTKNPASGQTTAKRAASKSPKRVAVSAGSHTGKGTNSRGASKAPAQVRKAVPFEEAKSAAIDALVETIEAAERRLVSVKRAASYDELQAIE